MNENLDTIFSYTGDSTRDRIYSNTGIKYQKFKGKHIEPGSDGIYRVSSIEERDLIHAKEDDLCVVYNSSQETLLNPPIAGNYIFPDIVILDTAIGEEEEKFIVFSITDKYVLANFILFSDSCMIRIDEGENSYIINYISDDGITYTKTDGIDNYTLPSGTCDVDAFDTECTNFMLFNQVSFSIYKYKNSTWSYLDIGINTNASDIRLDKLAYTSNGTIVGTMTDRVDLNIFVQTTEPVKKEGIWINSNLDYTDIIVDENIYLEKTWSTNKVRSLPQNKHQLGIQSGDYYFIWMQNSKVGYKYSFLTNQWTQIADKPTSSDIVAPSANLNYIFFFVPEGACYIYDITNNTYYQSYPVTTGYHGSGGSAIKDRVVYLFHSNKGYKIDYTLSFTNPIVTDISYSQYRFFFGNCYLVDNDIYLFGMCDSNSASSNPKIYKYNIISNTYTNLNTPNLPLGLCGNGRQYSGLVKKDDYIYLPPNYYSLEKAMQYISRYNITNNTFEIYANNLPIDMSYYVMSRCGFAYYNDNIHIMGYQLWAYTSSYTNTWYTTVQSITVKNKSYSNNSIIIKQSTTNVSGNRGAVIYSTNSITGRLKVPINNVYLYNNGTLYSDLPTYIGSGSSWIRIK